MEREDGNFTITKVRPGNYTLHAFADGVLGDFDQANITVEPGKTLNLGKLEWKPVRYGTPALGHRLPRPHRRQVLQGRRRELLAVGLEPALRRCCSPTTSPTPIGKSDYRKDWFFEEVPHATNLSFVNPAAKDPANQRFGWVKAESLNQYPQTNHPGRGPSTARAERPLDRQFNVAKQEHGTAALRVALAGVNGLRDGLAVGVNGQSIGAIGDGSDPDNARLITTDSIRYNADKGLNQQRTLGSTPRC